MTTGHDEPIRLSGDIDMVVRDEVEAVFAGAIAGSGQTVVVDLADVTFMDSSGLGAIGRAYGALREQGRTLTLSATPKNVRRVLEIAGFDHLCDDQCA